MRSSPAFVTDRGGTLVDGKLETLLHLSLDEERCALEAAVLVLMENGVVVNIGSLATLNHDSQELADLCVGVVGVVDVGLSPFTFAQHQAGKAVGTCSQETRRTANKAFVHDGDLQEVFCQGSGLEVVIVGLADAAQETHGTRPAKLKGEHAEHVTLSLENLILSIASVNHVNHLLDRGAVDFLVLRGKEDGSGTDELQLA